MIFFNEYSYQPSTFNLRFWREKKELFGDVQEKVGYYYSMDSMRSSVPALEEPSSEAGITRPSRWEEHCTMAVDTTGQKGDMQMQHTKGEVQWQQADYRDEEGRADEEATMNEATTEGSGD